MRDNMLPTIASHLRKTDIAKQRNVPIRGECCQEGSGLLFSSERFRTLPGLIRSEAETKVGGVTFRGTATPKVHNTAPFRQL